MEKDYFIHPTAIVDEGAIVGKGVKIWHFSHLMPGCNVGERCNIGQNVVISPDVILGKNVKVQNNVSIYTGVTCEDDPATCGIVPPTFNGFSNKTIRGYRFNPDTAKLLLAKAGYPNGKGFPKITLEINNGGEQHIRVAEAIQQMLKENLNIEVTIHEQSFTQHMQNYETGKSLFWRTSWVADYPDPESFLTVLYGKHVPANLYERSYVNSVRYQSVKFDSLFELALREQDGAKRLQLYAAADQVQVDDAAIMPIYYHENYRLKVKSGQSRDALTGPFSVYA